MIPRYIIFMLSVMSLVMMPVSACRKSPPPFECTDPIGCVSIGPGEPLKLGVIQNISGNTSELGRDQLRAIRLAVAERGGNFLGHPIHLQTEDERCLAEGGTTAALKVVADPQIVGVLGTTCSGAAVTAGRIISEAGLVMISGTNSAPSLTALEGQRGANWQPGFFRTIYSGAAAARAAAFFAFHKLGKTRAAVINDGDTYTRGQTEGFARLFGKLGGETVLVTAINKGDTDMRPVLTAVANVRAEVLYISLFAAESSFLIRQKKEVPGLESIRLIGGGSLLVDSFIEMMGTDGTGMYFAGPAPLKNPAHERLAAAYVARYGQKFLTPFYPYAYDAASLLLSAIRSVAIREEDGSLHIGRQALREALYGTAGFRGITGSLSCDEFGDCNAGMFDILRLDDPGAGLEGLRANVVYTYAPDRK